MKIILTHDVPKVGRKHEVKEVADGFGRNFLIARGKALLATPEALKKLSIERAASAEVAEQTAEAWTKTLAALPKTVLKLEVKASATGHLFAGLHAETLSRELKKKTGLEVPAVNIILADNSIKTIGEHQVLVKVGEREGSLKLELEGRP